MNAKRFRQIVVGLLALLMILGCILPALAAVIPLFLRKRKK